MRDVMLALVSPSAVLSSARYPLALAIAGAAAIICPQVAGPQPNVLALMTAPIDETLRATGVLFVGSTLPMWMLVCVLGARLRAVGRTVWLAWGPLYALSAAKSLTIMTLGPHLFPSGLLLAGQAAIAAFVVAVVALAGARQLARA